MLRILRAGAAVALVAAVPASARALGGAVSAPADDGVPKPTDVVHHQVPVDHYNAQDKRVFQVRSFVYDKHYKAGGPLFFYSGNEGGLESFYYNTGLPFDWAEQFGAMILFSEHRYYGETLPFGNESFALTNLGYLSIPQVLHDYAAVVTQFKAERKMSDAPVVVFGGSYGGMLAAWLRIKFPNVFDMALAASAPIPQIYNDVSPLLFFETITKVAAAADAECPDAVRSGFADMYELYKTEQGRAQLKSAFHLCADLPAGAQGLSHLMQYARNAWTEMAMCNYPYATQFLANLPANPVKVACGKAVAGVKNGTALAGLAATVNLVYDSKATCNNIDSLFVECADQTGCGTGNDAKAWDYQMCTALVYEQFSTNTTDMFPPRKWTVADLNAYCKQHYGVVPDLNATRIALGGAKLAPHVTSRIIFSNGMLDPWHLGGYLTDLSDDLPAVHIAAGAHHLDLRPANAQDPPSVVDARLTEKSIIRKWLASAGTPGSAAAAMYI